MKRNLRKGLFFKKQAYDAGGKTNLICTISRGGTAPSHTSISTLFVPREDDIRCFIYKHSSLDSTQPGEPENMDTSQYEEILNIHQGHMFVPPEVKVLSCRAETAGENSQEIDDQHFSRTSRSRSTLRQICHRPCGSESPWKSSTKSHVDKKIVIRARKKMQRRKPLNSNSSTGSFFLCNGLAHWGAIFLAVSYLVGMGLYKLAN